MTRVDTVEVVGLAGRADSQEFTLHPDVNVFFGLNGRGKTSLMKIIFSALRDNSRLLRSAVFDSATVKFHTHDFAMDITRTITSADVKIDNARSADFVVDEEAAYYSLGAQDRTEKGAAWVTVGESPSSVFSAKFLQTSRLYDDTHNRRGYVRDEAEIAKSFAEAAQRLWSQFTNKTLSEVTQAQQTGLATILEQAMFGRPNKRLSLQLDAKTAYQRSKDFLRRQGIKKFEPLEAFEKHYEEDPRLASLVHEIDKIERKIEIAEEPRKKLQSLVDEFFEDDKHLDLRDTGMTFLAGKVPVPLGDLSSGEKQLIRILLEVATAGRVTVLIDEPELSLHIDWQRKILGALRTVNPDAQIIVATHSPEVMAEVPDDRIFRV